MVARVILGNISGAYGLKVSKPGFDVTSTAAGNLLFDSSSGGLLRERATYLLNFNVVGNTTYSQTITHNLGVLPIVLWCSTLDSSGETSRHTLWTIATTTTQIQVGTRQAINLGACSIRLSLLTETA